MNKVFEDIYHLIWKELFFDIEPLAVEKFKEYYCHDLLLPKKSACSMDKDQIVYSGSEYTYKRLLSEKASEQRMQQDNWMQEKTSLGSLSKVLDKVANISFFRGTRLVNSDVVEDSDDIYSSSYVYDCIHIYTCQKMMFCNGNKESEYLMASKGSTNCSFSIRLLDCGSVSNSFDLHWCGKMSNTYFCHSCYDLRDCMFCFHINSKQYCIANIQYKKEEYEKLRDMILKQYFEQLNNPNGFKTLMDL